MFRRVSDMWRFDSHSNPEERIAALESQAKQLEERAEYAELEAHIRERLKAARMRIRAATATNSSRSLRLSSDIKSILGSIPTPAKVLLVLIALISLLLVVAKSCV